MITPPISHPVAPRFKNTSDNLVDLTRNTFRDKSTALWQCFESERRANSNNLESGFPVEDFFRQEFGALLHEPYSVGNGKIVDHQQYTCGDCDFIIYNKRLAPLLRAPATSDSRRKFFAFETTYGIIEVKSTLTLGAAEGGSLRSKPQGTLWDACKKIFAYKELHRTRSQAITWGTNHPIGIAFFYNCDIDISVQENRDAILAEFAAINLSVPIEMRVNSAYVLNKFSLSWGFLKNMSPDGPVFVNLQHPIESPHPTWASYSPTAEDTLYHMYTTLWSTLARTQLSPPDLLNEYGAEIYLRSRQYRCVPCSAEAHAESVASRRPDYADLTIAHMRGDYAQVERILSAAVDQDPSSEQAQLFLATFLYHTKHDNQAAERIFKRVLAEHPASTQASSDYAQFLASVRDNVAQGELILRQLVTIKSEDVAAQMALAMFLVKWQKASGEGIGILRKLAAEHPNDHSLLDAYATHLRNVEGARGEAERLYKEILSQNPAQVNTLGNYAQLLFWDARADEGRALLERALAAISTSAIESPAVVVELLFYQYAYVSEARNDALRKLKHFLLLGITSLGWDLDPDVVLATKDGHPQPRLLRLIADTIVGRIDLRVLQEDPEWKSIDD